MVSTLGGSGGFLEKMIKSTAETQRTQRDRQNGCFSLRSLRLCGEKMEFRFPLLFVLLIR
jgi:hypothetical protein